MSSPHQKNTGLIRIWKALFYSLDGLKTAFRHEQAFRQECALALVLLPLGLWIGKTAEQKALLGATVLLVLIVELLNSAIEAIVDKASPEAHELAKRAKDMGSAAVFISLVVAALTWAMVLFF